VLGLLPRATAVCIGAEYAITPNFTVKTEYLYDFINGRRALFDPGPRRLSSQNTKSPGQ
jgi:opacity protein-like surface antigen